MTTLSLQELTIKENNSITATSCKAPLVTHSNPHHEDSHYHSLITAHHFFANSIAQLFACNISTTR